MMIAMTQERQDRIADLQQQKQQLANRMETLGYSGNLARMHQLEQEMYEIEDSIKKLLGEKSQ